MNSNPDNDLLAGLVPQTQSSAPITPQPSHASIPQGTTDAVSKVQAERVGDATVGISLTPPPSAQVSNNTRTKSHTPTPTSRSDSHISTPPPTIHVLSQDRPTGSFAHAMTVDEIASAPADDLRLKVAELQAAYREAKMSAAHHRLQYQMLAQESAAAIERMAVEARMVQCENEVIHVAEQAKATSVPMLPSPMQDGTIPVQKDLYQRMCRDIQQLSETNKFLEAEHRQQEKFIFRQDNEIAGLSDKVLMLRDRIREHREHQNRMRSASIGGYLDSAPQSVLNTPRRPHMTSRDQSQPFAALLEASAMAREEVGTGRTAANRMMGKRGHSRNAQSLSSLPATPNRAHKQPPLFQTPQANLHFRAMPSTAPVPRTSNLRGPGPYSQPRPSLKRMHDAGSDGTVSASDNDDDDEHDSEAETEILEPDQIDESRASFSAARMLRANPQPLSNQPEEEHSFQPAKSGGGLRQAKLFGAVRKSNAAREDEPPAKKPRTIRGIGLGIKGVSHR